VKTRIVHTKFWIDGFVTTLQPKEKLAFLYFFTNETIGLTGVYELPDRNICFDLGITQKELDDIKQKLSSVGKVGFMNGYVILTNSQKYCDYEHGNDRQRKSFESEKKSIPEEVWKYRESLTSQQLVNDQSVTSPRLVLNHKSENINNKKGIVKGEEKKYSKLEDITDVEISQVAQKYEVAPKVVKRVYEELVDYCEGKGKKYDNYLATLRGWVRRRIDEKPQIVGLKQLSEVQIKAIRAGNLSMRIMEEDGYDTSIFRAN